MRGRCRRRCSEDRIPNAFDILQDFIVPETQDAVATLCEPLITRGIALIFRVLAAIHLDHKPFLSTNKVDEIGPDGFLTHEFEASKRSGAKVSPQLCSACVESLRSRLANRVFVTFAPRMRRGPLTPTLSPQAGRGRS